MMNYCQALSTMSDMYEPSSPIINNYCLTFAKRFQPLPYASSYSR